MGVRDVTANAVKRTPEPGRDGVIDQTSPALGYPEGWFRVAYSNDLKTAQVVPLRYFGRDLVMFRTESGVAQILDAYCAHLGAHLGVGGTVAGETVRCPFHAWQYGTDGICKTIPYSKTIPKAAQVTSWPTVERSGLILMWYSSVRNAPLWDAPALPEYHQAGWTPDYLRQRYTLRSCPQEIVENVPDLAHFSVVHGNNNGASPPDVKFSFEAHIMTADLQLNLPATGSRAHHVARIYGLGLVVNLSIAIGNKSFWTTYTPIDERTVEVDFAMLAALNTPTDPTGAISDAARQVTLREFEKDIPIWENKIYRANPLICPGDGPIARFRAWSRQFYPHAS